MSNNGGKLLSQEEIDALLNSGGQAAPPPVVNVVEEVAALSPEDMDALGEVGNISMGASSTTLSALLNQRVEITSPRVRVMSEEQFWDSFKPPYMTIRVQYTKGLSGFNLWVIKLHDALVMADLMMGGEGNPSTEEITELEISAASEAMNQMIGTSATSLATMFNRTVDISPPQTKLINEGELPEELDVEGPLVVAFFQMTVGDIMNTEIMQVMSLETAKDQVSLLMNEMDMEVEAPVSFENILTLQEKDALGEVGNISTGSASTTLSALLNQRVQITSPRISVFTEKELFASFQPPFMTVKVYYTEGIVGFNLWIVTLRDALIVADLMMGGEGTPEAREITELEISAASEAMNQMIGTSATSLASMFNRTINISPPETNIYNEGQLPENMLDADPLVVVSFRMTVGDVLDTEIMQIMSVDTAKHEAGLLLSSMDFDMPEPDLQARVEESVSFIQQPKSEDPEPLFVKPLETVNGPPMSAFGQNQMDQKAVAEEPVFPTPPNVNWDKINLILDVPLNVTVVLGKTKRPIKDVLGLTPGSVVELGSLVEEPVEVLVNGPLGARGEVVVVNENFGVRITNVITPQERIQYLMGH